MSVSVSTWPTRIKDQFNGRRRMGNFTVTIFISTYIGKNDENTYQRIIVEDEKPARDLLKNYLEDFLRMELDRGV